MLLLFLLPVYTTAFPYFASLIPNGRSVPNPGPQGGVWAGVGHLNAAGGGPRNPFGLDFKDQGYEWTVDLCIMDSDQDGRSNGEELGDPNCLWTPGGQEPSGPALSHPGIPDSPREVAYEPCDTYQAPPDVQVMDVQFSAANQIDASRTHYRCEQMQIDAPLVNAQYYHQIKSEVLLDNPNILHHMWIYLCDDGIDSTDGNMVGQGPYSCSGMEGNCQIIAGWAVGAKDFCEPPNVGAWIDFGFQGKITIKIEAHYDNGQGVPQADDSGMRLSLTPTPRPLGNGFTILGMDYWDREFSIPGGEKNFELSNICPTSATMLLEEPLFVYSWNPHMHLYGKKLVTEHYRCGRKIGEIGRIDDFEFDNQQSYHYERPIKILPGDALVTTCVFDTTNVAEGTAIAGGESTTEEMCDNYLTYYPWAGNDTAPNLFTACSSFNMGVNPDLADYDDSLPFVTLDLGGELFLTEYETDPTHNVAPCCATDSCESMYLASEGQPCGVDSDCTEGLECDRGLCVVSRFLEPEETDESETPSGDGNDSENVPNQESAGCGFPVINSVVSFLTVFSLLSWTTL